MEINDLSGSPRLLFCSEADYKLHDRHRRIPPSLLFPDFSNWNLGDLCAEEREEANRRDDRYEALREHSHRLFRSPALSSFSPSITTRHEGVHCGFEALDFAAPGLELNLGIDADYATDLPVNVHVESDEELRNRRSFEKQRSKKISHGGKLQHLRGSGKAFGNESRSRTQREPFPSDGKEPVKEPVDMEKLRRSVLALREDAAENDLNRWLLTTPAGMDIDVNISHSSSPDQSDSSLSSTKKIQSGDEHEHRGGLGVHGDEHDDNAGNGHEHERYAEPALTNIAEALNAYTHSYTHLAGNSSDVNEAREEEAGRKEDDDPAEEETLFAAGTMGDWKAVSSAAEASMESIQQEVLKLTQDTARFLKDGVLPSAGGKEKSVGASKWVSVATHEDMSNFSTMVPKLALKVPFELDNFQKQAVVHLERGESVFIGAHTSAGKTIVAEYAIALALQHRTRVVYTSPIKALSNQKFRDFQRKFGNDNVGLITGDVSLNPSGACLVMTTEILRSMLYRGADLVRDIEWVVFDEVHYINDVDRGVVWEEVIIMLPEEVGLIFLSATTPNTQEFSSWIGRTKRQNVFVITTEKRPVPLQHFLFSANKFHMIKDSKGHFLTAGYTAAKKAKSESNKPATANAKTSASRGRGKRCKRKGESLLPLLAVDRTGESMRKATSEYWAKLIRRLDKDKLTPTVVFTFSKKKCDERAASLTTVDLDFSSRKEPHPRYIPQIFSAAQSSG